MAKTVLKRAREIEGLTNELIDKIDELQHDATFLKDVGEIPRNVDLVLDDLREFLDAASVSLSEEIDMEDENA